jgi:hypothetical protein
MKLQAGCWQATSVPHEFLNAIDIPNPILASLLIIQPFSLPARVFCWCLLSGGSKSIHRKLCHPCPEPGALKSVFIRAIRVNPLLLCVLAMSRFSVSSSVVTRDGPHFSFELLPQQFAAGIGAFARHRQRPANGDFTARKWHWNLKTVPTF